MSKSYRHPYEGGAEVDWAQWGPDDVEDGGKYRERERKMLDYLEKVTSQPELEQKLHLEYILKKNAGTEYLTKHGMDGATDVDSFRWCIPVVDYEAFRESVDRIAAGDTSPILSADPSVEVLISSGTSSGEQKIFPVTREDLEFRGLVWSFISPTLSRAMPSLGEGKFLNLVFHREGSNTAGGLPARTAVTSFVLSEGYQNRLFHPMYNITSPNEVMESPDTNSAIYGHLLCSLLQRDEIRRVGAMFATVVIKVLRFLEDFHTELLEDIAAGTLSTTFVQDDNVRAAVMPLLLEKGPEWRAELARSLQKECISEIGRFRADGIVHRLFPNCEVIDTGGTGVMKEYLPTLLCYSNKMRIICTPLYSATEGFFGVNMNPSLPPEETFYVLVPTVAYYEFIAIGASKAPSASATGLSSKVHPTGDTRENGLQADANANATTASEEQVLDLVSLEIGKQYELLVTTISGYCRLRMGDILEVVDRYNDSPLFKFVRKKNILLSVDNDKTDEVELQAAVRTAALALQKEIPVLRLLEYTSYTDFEGPGHYVIVWELRSTSASGPYTSAIPSPVLEKCCAALESSFNYIYREGRFEGTIGPLELNLVQPGTFDLLCEYAVSRGASISQYKVPRGLNPKQGHLKNLIMARVRQIHFSSTRPPFTPTPYKAKHPRLS